MDTTYSQAIVAPDGEVLGTLPAGDYVGEDGLVYTHLGQRRQLAPSHWPAGARLVPLALAQHEAAHAADRKYDEAIVWEASGSGHVAEPPVKRSVYLEDDGLITAEAASCVRLVRD